MRERSERMLMSAVFSFYRMDVTTGLCVTFVLMVNFREVLSVCIKLYWVGAWGLELMWGRGSAAFKGEWGSFNMGIKTRVHC